MLMRYFRKDEDSWRIADTIRAMAQFREFNLLSDLRSLGRFDIVFCRNVLIYFDQPTKTRVLEAIAGLMPPDGLLYLGGAETVLGITPRSRRCRMSAASTAWCPVRPRRQRHDWQRWDKPGKPPAPVTSSPS